MENLKKTVQLQKNLFLPSNMILKLSKKEFAESFSQFAKGHQSIKVTNHPFWGKMTYEDWDKLIWKHVHHHLRQFQA